MKRLTTYQKEKCIAYRGKKRKKKTSVEELNTKVKSLQGNENRI